MTKQGKKYTNGYEVGLSVGLEVAWRGTRKAPDLGAYSCQLS